MIVATDTCIWLATPDAAARFDPARQTAADADRWVKLGAPSRRSEWAASRALLAHLSDLQLTQASLSHSRGWSAALVAPAGVRVGIDLECVRPRDTQALADYAFSESEATALRTLPAAERLLRFHALWTLKEAFAKALGLSLLPALRDCCFDATGDRWFGRVPVDTPWQALIYAPRPGLVLSVAVVGETTGHDPAIEEWPGSLDRDWSLLGRVAPA